MTQNTPDLPDSGKPKPSVSSNHSPTTFYWLGLIFTISVLGLSLWLEPAEKGFGTHTQLGLPECSFKRITGVPGPSCGMTTSFAYMSTGYFVDAVRSNLFGVLLFFLLISGGIESLLQLFEIRYSLLDGLVRMMSFRYLFVLFVFWMLCWVLKLHIFAGHI